MNQKKQCFKFTKQLSHIYNICCFARKTLVLIIPHYVKFYQNLIFKHIKYFDGFCKFANCFSPKRNSLLKCSLQFIFLPLFLFSRIKISNTDNAIYLHSYSFFRSIGLLAGFSFTTTSL